MQLRNSSSRFEARVFFPPQIILYRLVDKFSWGPIGGPESVAELIDTHSTWPAATEVLSLSKRENPRNEAASGHESATSDIVSFILTAYSKRVGLICLEDFVSSKPPGVFFYWSFACVRGQTKIKLVVGIKGLTHVAWPLSVNRFSLRPCQNVFKRPCA